MTKKFVYFVGFLMLFALNIFPQPIGKNPALIARNSTKNCRVFLNGKLLNNPQPVYPIEAKVAGVSGKVAVAVEIDEQGNVIEIESVNGEKLLIKTASDAALQAKFSPTLCDGTPAKNIGIITFNFPKINLTDEYFKATKLEEFKDVTQDKNYYEAVSLLTENYRIAFGYVDKNFHGEMPLTKGDFIHYLRQILEILEWRGKLAGKPIKEIRLYQSYNPNKVKEIEYSPKSPFAESINILSEKYKIVLAEKGGYISGDSTITITEIIEIWRNIFGEEAIPIHFLNHKDADKEITRGDFAIYLKESLDVLSYKILP